MSHNLLTSKFNDVIGEILMESSEKIPVMHVHGEVSEDGKHHNVTYKEKTMSAATLRKHVKSSGDAFVASMKDKGHEGTGKIWHSMKKNKTPSGNYHHEHFEIPSGGHGGMTHKDGKWYDHYQSIHVHPDHWAKVKHFADQAPAKSSIEYYHTPDKKTVRVHYANVSSHAEAEKAAKAHAKKEGHEFHGIYSLRDGSGRKIEK